jgi:hypothetical protein
VLAATQRGPATAPAALTMLKVLVDVAERYAEGYIWSVPEQPSQPRGSRVLTRIGLGILTTLVSVNLWTGGPLLALWVGSRVQAAVGQLSMGAMAATVAVLIGETILLYKVLSFLSVRYDEAIGREAPRRQLPWLKPMTGERRAEEVRQPLTAVEKIVILTVVVAVMAFEIWFFFFAHYSLPSGS